MNIFSWLNKIMAGDKREQMLGCALHDPFAIERRQTHFANLTGGNGFRQVKKDIATDAEGMTRGQKKRARHRRTVEKIKAEREVLS